MNGKIKLPIYLDYMATAPVDPAVVKTMLECLDSTGVFGNPASNTHKYGWDANAKVEMARQQVASLINADAKEIVWTSGATEANNLAIKGAALFYQRQGKHIITMSTEHKAVLDTCDYLASTGFEVTYLNPKPDGLLNLDDLKAAIRKDTILITIMFANNETGVIQDIAAIGKIAHEHGILFHSDAAQAAGKIPIDLQNLPVDLMSFSAHKIYGPKGIGVLFVRRKPRVRLEPLLHGGGHEGGVRSGTLATHQIAGMGEAFAIAKKLLDKDYKHCKKLRDKLWNGIRPLGDIKLNGHKTFRLPNCLNVSIAGVDGESLLLSLRNLAISAGSACTSTSGTSSHVLCAMGLTDEQADQSLRISVGRFTNEAEIDFAIKEIVAQVEKLRSSSPIWQAAKERVKRKMKKA